MKMPPWLLMLGFIVLYIGDNLLIRVASQRTGWPAFNYFAAGNVLGFIATILITLALRTAHPNLVFAICHGGAFCLLQLATFYFFRVPLSNFQWFGVGLIAVGVVFVQFSPAR